MASPEALLISAVLRSGDQKEAIGHGITAEMFMAHPDEWRWVEHHVNRYGKLPSKAAFKSKFPEFMIYQVDEVGAFAEEVKQEYARAALTDVMDNAIDLMMKGNIDKAMTTLGSDLLHIQARVQDQNHDYDVVSDWQGTYDDVKRRIERVRTVGRAGVPTGFSTLDLSTGGLQPGWVMIVGGRLGHGKTYTMVRMACEAALCGYTALYYSLEQSRHQIAQRTHGVLSAKFGEKLFRPLDLMRGAGFDIQEYRDFLDQMGDVLPGRLVINDTTRGRVSPMTIAAAIERDEPDVVFIDYMTLMSMKGDGGWLSVADLSASIQQIGQRYEVPMVVGAQMNRLAINDDSPDPGMIGRSDTVGQDADIVLTVAKKSKSVRKLTLAKFRHGPDGIPWFVRWKPNNGDIEEISGDEAGDLMESDKEVD